MASTGRVKQRINLVVRLLLAAVFIAAGLAKLSGAEQMVQIFSTIGLGQWFRYFTGVVELIGAVLIVWPRFATIGAVLLATTMVCAVCTHLFVIGGNPLPAIVLAVLCGAVGFDLRDRMPALRLKAALQ